ncbi:MAG: hypothetical protein ACLQUY_06730 [Ktedonobacterales bacterium]
MSDQNQDPARESFEVEISHLPLDGEGESFPVARLSPHARTWRIALGSSTFLVLLAVLVASVPALRSQVRDAVQGLMPIPTATLAPGADLLAIETDVPWTAVTLDGHRISVPRVGVSVPQRLARGTHTLTWTAEPFQPQRCTLIIPDSGNASTCDVTLEALPSNTADLTAVVYLHESLASLTAIERQALIQTTQAALSGFSDTVLPGESYLGGGIATNPLQATLNMQLQTDGTSVEGCWFSEFTAIAAGSGDCTLDGMSCLQFCTVPWQVRVADASTLGTKEEWLTLAIVHSMWDYATSDGRAIASDQPIDSGQAALDSQPVLLRIGWDSRQWQVRPLFGPEQGAPITGDDGMPVTDDPGCLAAEDIFNEDIPIYATIRFISGSNPAAGCLVEATLVAPTGTPALPTVQVEEYLVRFGFVAAVNPLAHRRNPKLPLADGNEQQLARQLATLSGGLTATLIG